MRKRFLLSYSQRQGFYVDLPHYQMVPGTHAPIVNGYIHADGVLPGIDAADALKHKPSVLVDLPDGIEFGPDGEIDRRKLQGRYGKGTAFGMANYLPPKVLGDR